MDCHLQQFTAIYGDDIMIFMCDSEFYKLMISKSERGYKLLL